MKPLTFFEALREQPIPRDQVEDALRRAAMARELKNERLFKWWREVVEDGLKRKLDELETTMGDIGQIRRKQGIIIGVKRLFRDLDRMAESVEALQERMQEYGRDS